MDEQQQKNPQAAPGPLWAARIAPLLVLATGICWGVVGLFVRPLEAVGLSSFQICWVRTTLAAIMLLCLGLVRDRSALRIRLRDLWCFLGTGLVSVVFFSICYYTTISLTSLSFACVLMYTAPAFVLLLSRPLFGEVITPRKLCAVALIIVGCVFASGLVAGVPALAPMGVLIGLGSGIGYALYSIFSRFALQRGYSPLAIAAWTFTFAAIGSSFIGAPAQTTALLVANPPVFGIAFGLALVNAVVPYVLYTTGLKYMENGRAAVIVSIEPIVASVLGVAVFGESFAWYNGVGIALVVLAIGMLSWQNKQQKQQP